MRTLNNKGSRALTVLPQAPRTQGSGSHRITLAHSAFTLVHGQSVIQSVIYLALSGGPRRRGTLRIEDCLNTDDETTSGAPVVPSRLLTRSEAATYLRRSTGTLANWAAKRKGPVYYRQEDGAVVYAIEDLAQWLTVQRVLPKVA